MIGGGSWAERFLSIFGSGWGYSPRAAGREAARRFGVSASTAIRIAASQAARGTLAPRRQGRPPGQGKLATYLGFLVELVEAVPDITMPELARALEAEHGVKVDPSSISRALIRAGMMYKKSR